MSKNLPVVIYLFIILIPLGLLAQTTGDAIRITDNQTDVGARALGMGGAYSAVADDYSAIYWNPAGLAQMRKMEYWISISNLRFHNDITYQQNPSNASINATKFNSIGLVFPVPTYRGSLVFGLGYQRIKDFEYANEFQGISSLFSEGGKKRLRYELDTTGTIYNFYDEPVRKKEYVTDRGNMNQWSAAGAVDVSPNISVGATLTYWTGSSDYNQEFTQIDVFNHFDQYPANFYDYQETNRLSTDYSAFSIKAGGLARAGRFFRGALGLEFPKTFNVNEDWHTSSSVSFDTTNVGDIEEIIYFPDEQGEFEYDVKMPFKFFGGASFALGPVLLSGSFEYMDWSQVEFDVPSDAELNSGYSELLKQNKEFRRNYRGTWKLRAGGELGVPFLQSQFRAGFIYDPTPLKGLDAEKDRKYVSLGYGVLIDRVLKLDVAFLHGFWKQTTFDNLAPAGTDEDVTYQKLVFTLAYRY